MQVDLVSGFVTGGSGNDTLSHIELVEGSRFGDTLVGNDNANWLSGDEGNDHLSGGAGDDSLQGGPGADVLEGGLGNDTATYWGFDTSTVGVTADLSNAANNTGDAAGDTYTSIENLSGSNFADTLKGDANANVLTGGLGGDTFVYVTGGGADTISDFNHGEGDKIDLTGVTVSTRLLRCSRTPPKTAPIRSSILAAAIRLRCRMSRSAILLRAISSLVRPRLSR